MRTGNLIGKNITPHKETAPYGVDMAITGIQTSLESVAWLKEGEITKSFGRAKIMSNIENDQRQVFPVCKVSDTKDHLPMIGNDSFKAYSFMVAKDPEEIEGYNEGNRIEAIRDIDLIVWMNLERIGNDNTEQLKQDVLNRIGAARFIETGNGSMVSGIEITEINDEPERVFEDFTVNIDKTQLLYYPYYGIRISMTAFYSYDCSL